MTSTISIRINPNLRVDGGLTMADLDEDVHGGPVHESVEVVVIEPVSGLTGRGKITELDEDERTVTVWVDWGSLKIADNAAVPAAYVPQPQFRWPLISSLPHPVS